MKKLGMLLCLAVGLSSTAWAQGSISGNAEDGKNKSQLCGTCHGTDGNSMIELNPNLAGQHAKYLSKQLKEFRLASQTGGAEGRNNAVMNGMSAALSDQDIADLSAYFASQEAKPLTTPEDVVAAGEALYRGGDLDRGITACIACHGPRGNGTGLSGFPKISGQHATYTKAQLQAFRSGERANDLNGMMRDIAMKLTDDDIEILSKYLGGLH